MLYLGWIMIFVVMVGMFVLSSLLIGPKITAAIWLTSAVIMALFAYGFYLVMGGTL